MFYIIYYVCWNWLCIVEYNSVMSYRHTDWKYSRHDTTLGRYGIDFSYFTFTSGEQSDWKSFAAATKLPSCDRYDVALEALESPSTSASLSLSSSDVAERNAEILTSDINPDAISCGARPQDVVPARFFNMERSRANPLSVEYDGDCAEVRQHRVSPQVTDVIRRGFASMVLLGVQESLKLTVKNDFV